MSPPRSPKALSGALAAHECWTHKGRSGVQELIKPVSSLSRRLGIFSRPHRGFWQDVVMPFTLREPALPDAPQIAELHVASWRETYSHLLSEDFFTEEHVQSRYQMWSRILGNPLAEWSIRIAECRGQVIGFAFFGPSFGPEGQELPRDRQLFSLYVTAEHHGTGVGQGLLDATAGDGPAMLWVAKENLQAVAFYRRNGFEFDGAEQTDPGAPAIVDARMVR